MSSLNTVNIPVMVSQSPSKTQLNDETILHLHSHLGRASPKGVPLLLLKYERLGTFTVLVCKRGSLSQSTKLYRNLDRNHNAKGAKQEGQEALGTRMGFSCYRHLFPRSCESYFRLPFLIFVPSVLSANLEQAGFDKFLSQKHWIR